MKKYVSLLLILMVLLFGCHQSRSQSLNLQPLIFDHDGGYDDFLSLIMLLSMPDVDLKGIVITPADCYPRPAISATLKILRLFGRQDIEVSQATLAGTNSFPREWRAAVYRVDALPILNEPATPLTLPVSEPGHRFLARKLREAKRPLKLLITGPLTNLAKAISTEPGLTSKIDEVIWMGGAIAVPGNVQDYEHDGSAEWNAYWDPPAVKTVFDSDLDITIFPLDITNQLPVTMNFLTRLAKQRNYPVSDLAGQIWAMTVGTIPAYEYMYYMWDTLTTGYLGAPQLFSIKNVQCKVMTGAPSAGKIKSVDRGGKRIRMANAVDVDEFFNYVIRLLQK